MPLERRILHLRPASRQYPAGRVLFDVGDRDFKLDA